MKVQLETMKRSSKEFTHQPSLVSLPYGAPTIRRLSLSHSNMIGSWKPRRSSLLYIDDDVFTPMNRRRSRVSFNPEPSIMEAESLDVGNYSVPVWIMHSYMTATV